MAKQEKEINTKKKVNGFFKGFKEFIAKGNIIDMAIGVVIGAAFGRVITALVNGIILPPLAYAMGEDSFDNLRYVLSPATADIFDPNTGELLIRGTSEIAIRWGSVLQTALEFVIIAFVIYTILTLIIRRKQFNEKLIAEERSKNQPAPVEEIPADILLLTEIRDLLNKPEQPKEKQE